MMRYLDSEDEFEAETHHEENHSDNSKPWGEVIGACIVVQLITLTGVFVSGLVAVSHKQRMKNGKSGDIYQLILRMIIPAFGAGALLATAVFLLIPESLELIGGGHDDHGSSHDAHEEGEHEDEDHEDEDHIRYLEEATIESHNDATWKFGASVLGGFLLPAILHALFPHHTLDDVEDEQSPAILDKTENGEKAEEGEEEGEEEVLAGDEAEDLKKQANQEALDTEQPTEAQPAQTKNWSLASSLLLGDFFHNFADGIFIGAAFELCGSDIGWTITATTIYHELAQEVADFALLTHHCGFKIWEALLLNFGAGISIFLGGIVVLASDISDLAVGVLLAMSAGVYIYIGGAECIPRAQKAAKGVRNTLIFLACICLGAIPIGLVLLEHGHCSSGGHSGHEEGEHEEGEHEDGDHEDGDHNH